MTNPSARVEEWFQVQKTMLGCPLLIPHMASAKAVACVSTHALTSRSLTDKRGPAS